jgi:hypothetical protein
MAVIQLDVDEKLIQAIGAQTVKDFVERQLSLLRLEYLGEKIATAIQRSDMDHEVEVEAARKEAWEEYGAKFLKDVR